MREIKFRAWDGENMLNNVVPICGDKPGNMENIVEYSSLAGFRLRPVKAVMQFTGLHDKNGREIYEGDVLKHNGTNRNSKMNPHVIVEFLGGAFCLTAPHGSYLLSQDSSVTIRDAMFEAKEYGRKLELEVIGNIHDNPEPLEGGSAQ